MEQEQGSSAQWEGHVIRDECYIYIFYTSTGNTHACGFKAQEEASDAALHAILSSGSRHVMNLCRRS